MAQQAKAGGGDFIANLGKIYGLYTGGFFGFVILLALFEYFGKKGGIPANLVNAWLGYGFVFLTLAVYAVIGWLSRTMQMGEYYVAGRQVPSFYNGMATGADWMSAASFISMAGTLFLLGYDGLAYVLGWTGGYVLVAILIAPFLRKFGAYTVPDFFSERYGGNFARFLAVVVLVCCSFTYVVAQIVGTGLIAQRFLGMSFEIAVFVGLIGILLCSMLGGMKAVTWTQVAQYIVLIIAYLIPVVWLSTKKYGIPVPELTYGQALQDIAALEKNMIDKGWATAAALKPHTQPFTTFDPLNYFALIFCMMVGTASLPHILMRYFTTPSVREARSSVAWSLFFIFMLYFTAPSYAAFSKLEVYENLIGKPISQIPAWVYQWGPLQLVSICGQFAKDAATVAAACAARGTSVVRLQDFTIVNDAIVIATPEIAGLPYVITGLVAAGGLAAALSTADGLLLAIANALSHDMYYKTIAPIKSSVLKGLAGLVGAGLLAAGMLWLIWGKPTFGFDVPFQYSVGAALALITVGVIPFWVRANETGRRLVLARVLLLVVAIAGASAASTKPSDIVAMVAWAFSLAASGIFPALVMGIWWKRASAPAAVVGMVLGFGVCVYYLVGTRYFGPAFYETWSWLSSATPAEAKRFLELKQAWASAAAGDAKLKAWEALDAFARGTPVKPGVANWFGLHNISAALLGVPIGFLAIWLVSLVTAAPPKIVQDMIDEVRKPRGETFLKDKSEAPAH